MFQCIWAFPQSLVPRFKWKTHSSSTKPAWNTNKTNRSKPQSQSGWDFRGAQTLNIWPSAYAPPYWASLWSLGVSLWDNGRRSERLASGLASLSTTVKSDSTWHWSRRWTRSVLLVTCEILGATDAVDLHTVMWTVTPRCTCVKY